MTRLSACRTPGEMGTVVSCFILSVSDGHRMKPYGPSASLKSSYVSEQTAEMRRPVPFTMSRISER